MGTNRNEHIYESMISLVGRKKILMEAAYAIFSLLFYNHSTNKKGYEYVYPIWTMHPDIREEKCNDLRSIEEAEKQSTPMQLMEFYKSLQVNHAKQDNHHNYIIPDLNKF